MLEVKHTHEHTAPERSKTASVRLGGGCSEPNIQGQKSNRDREETIIEKNSRPKARFCSGLASGNDLEAVLLRFGVFISCLS